MCYIRVNPVRYDNRLLPFFRYLQKDNQERKSNKVTVTLSI